MEYDRIQCGPENTVFYKNTEEYACIREYSRIHRIEKGTESDRKRQFYPTCRPTDDLREKGCEACVSAPRGPRKVPLASRAPARMYAATRGLN